MQHHQHQQHKGGSGRGGRSRQQQEQQQQQCSSRNDATPKTRSSAAGRDPALQQEAPHPEWNASDWRRWDETHGHMLWMGALQEDWTNATIAGFFRHHGAEITVTRKGRDNYCFVGFATTEEAKNFMARYNHEPLPGLPSMRFNIRPRTRPRWYREAEHRSSGTAGGGDRGDSDHGNGNRNGIDNVNPRDHRNESGTDGRVGRKRQQFRGVKTENLSDRANNQSHRTRQAQTGGMKKTADRGYYGRGRGGRDLGGGGPDRGGRQEQPPGLTPSSRQRAVPDRGGNPRDFRRINVKVPARGRSRSHSWSRSPPRSRLRPQSGSSPPRGDSRDGSRRGSRGQDSVQPRRQYDPSFRQVQQTSDGEFDGGSSEHGSHRVPSHASAASRDSLRGDERFPAGEGGIVLPGGDKSDFAADRCSRNGYVGAKRRITTVNSPTNVATRTDGCTSRRSDAQKTAERGAYGGGAEGVGRGEENPAVQYFGNDRKVNSHRHAILDSDGGHHDSDSLPKQGTASRGEHGFHGGEEHGSATPTTTALDDGELTTRQPEHAESGVQSSDTGTDNPSEEHPEQEESPSSPRTAGGEGNRGHGETGHGFDNEESSPGQFSQPQSPTRTDETSRTRMIGLERGIRAGTGDISRIHGDPLNEDRHINGGLIPADDPLNQKFNGGVAEDVNLVTAIHTLEAAESADRQRDIAHLTSASCSGSSGWATGGRDTSNEVHSRRSNSKEEGEIYEGVTGKGNLHGEGARYIRRSPLPPRTALPSGHSPPSGSRKQADAGTGVAPPSGSSLILGDGGEGLHQPEENIKEHPTIESAREATMRRNDGDSGRGSRPNEGRRSDPPSVVESRAKQTVDEGGFEVSPGQNPQTTPPPRRGTKRRHTADVTLSQVIEHHMARRRLKGVVSGPQGSLVRSISPHRSASSGHHHISSAPKPRGTKHRLGSEWPPSADPAAATIQSPRPEGSTIVAAAWANGCVLPLTAAAAPHMRLVAPVLATEPEGRRVVVRTASAAAAAASILALPEYRFEVTGMCRDGLLLELHPKDEGNHGKGSFVRGEESEKMVFLSELAGQLQDTIGRLVALDLEFDMVPLPQGEAVDAMATGSSSVELLKWLNEGTTTLLRLAPTPPSTGASSADQAPGGGDPPLLVELRKALAHQGGGGVLGIDCGLWPLLPRTGLLGCFNLSVRPVVLPPPELTGRGNCKGRSPAIHLAVTLSGSGTFHDGNSGSLGALHGGGFQSARSTDGLLVANNPNAKDGAATSDVATADPSQLDARPLGCAPPTCTTNGLTWRDVSGLKCVAAVNRLALGSQKELDGKIQLAEGLHTAQVEALAKKIAVSGALLVVLAGRQGASVDVVASRLCVELTLKGKNPATVDTTEYLRRGASQSFISAEAGHRQTISSASPAPSSIQHLDSASLDRAVATLLGQARAGVGLSAVENGGSRAAAGGASIAGLGAPAPAWPSCDVVVVYGCEVLDAELLPPGGFDLAPSETLSVFVDLVPQICVDNLTPVNGADVRMLRGLLTARGSFAAAAELANFAGKGGGDGNRRPSVFDTDGFLNGWFATEEREEGLCRSFRAAANVHMNTALPYDLNALKPLVEPLLRSVPPPTSGHENGGGGGGDGCRSSTYALSRSVLRLLQLCETLPARGAGQRYPYSPA